MDPISATALSALAGGIGGEAGRQAWTALSALIRRPFRGGEADGALVVSSGEAELTALAGNPDELERAHQLRTALAVRAALDAEFRLALDNWWQQAQSVRTGESTVTNQISGGTQYGPVVQGRDFNGLTITAHGAGEPRATPAGTHGPTRPDTEGSGPPYPGGRQED
ncbi:hypothetical protein [Streptomyces sp. NPDC047070]|uniref:hypothetical protein n=1 Tax=Streptomyces sp. NPDC047070 TaxID=3154923 RepID=UPI003454E0FF